MYIYKFSNFVEKVDGELSDKKALLTKKFNRSDNFINLTLVGVQRCVEDTKLPSNTSIYLASDNGNMNTTIKVLDSIFIKNRLPMPFNFLNTVNSVKLFYIAKNFNIDGKTIFVDSFESAIIQAFVDIKQGKNVLLGVVTEAIDDLELHREMFGDKEIIESSRWLLLSPKPDGAIAKIEEFQLSNSTTSKTKTSKLFSFLESNKNSFSFKRDRLSFSVKKML